MDPGKHQVKPAALHLGAGLEFEIGRQLFTLEVRYDWGLDSLGLGRSDPKPDELTFVIGRSFRIFGK